MKDVRKLHTLSTFLAFLGATGWNQYPDKDSACHDTFKPSLSFFLKDKTRPFGICVRICPSKPCSCSVAFSVFFTTIFSLAFHSVPYAIVPAMPILQDTSRRISNHVFPCRCCLCCFSNKLLCCNWSESSKHMQDEEDTDGSKYHLML